MEGTENSTSSRQFREKLLKDSIMSMLNPSARNSADVPATAQPQSQTSTTAPTSSRAESNINSSPSSKQNSVGQTTTSLPLVGNEQEKAEQSEPEAIYNGKRDPFAGGIEGGVEYKSMVWWHAGMVMVAETISLGILALPMSMHVLGLIPGLILLIILGAMATYSGYVIGQFKIAYPHIHSFADAGEVLFGKWGGEFWGAAALMFFVFIMASHILTFSIAMKALTGNGYCTILWMFVGTIISLIFTLPRTLKHLSYYSAVSFASIIAAVMITMIAVGISKPGWDYAEDHNLKVRFRLFPAPHTPFYEGFLAMSNMVFAYAGHVAFFSFISELKDPKDFPKALAFLQISDISMYIITAVVVYVYTGSTIDSPALRSAGPVVQKVAFGIAMPTIIIAGVVNGHVAVKYIYVRMLRNKKEDIMHQRSVKAIGLWVGICTVLWFLAWLITEVIPVFPDLLGVTSALFASWFTFGFSGVFWFHLNFQRGERWDKFVPKEKWTWQKTVVAAVNGFNIITGLLLCVAGLYASGKSILNSSTTTRPFSC